MESFKRAPVKIAGTGSYLPDYVLTNEELAQRTELNTCSDWIIQRTGIMERRIVKNGEYTSDLAARAAERAMEMAGITAKDIDLILAATVTPDNIIPSLGCRIQECLGCREIGAVDLSAACSGFVYTLGMARNMVVLDGYKNVLVVGAESLTKVLDWQDRETCVIFADGAGAVVLQPISNGRHWIGPSFMGSRGRADLFSIPAGGSRRPASIESVMQRDHYMKMNGRELFKFVVQRCIKMIRFELVQHGITLDDIKYIIPHQANQRIMDTIADRMKIPREKVYSNIAYVGNTSAASIPIALDDMNRKGLIEPGDLIMFCAFGAGVTWASSVMCW